MLNDPSPLVGEDDEHEEHPEGDGRHDEEVDGHDQLRTHCPRLPVTTRK
jgi:hypothetical protein